MTYDSDTYVHAVSLHLIFYYEFQFSSSSYLNFSYTSAASVFSAAAGLLFGTAGIKVLSSKDAKKVYTNCTAAALLLLHDLH